MTQLEIILSFLLFASLAFNIGVFVYARAAILRLLWVSEELGDLKTMTTAFSEHLESVYSLETFYGDQTIENLIDHARSYDEQLSTFEFIYSLTENDEETDVDDDEESGTETEEA